ncbi:MULTISPECIES: hypothetical protein [Lysinibacillus]|uniref:Uncharacterized protein n=1 Tax=Lysinibacillus xylanilyticus TaxID=582475 RepID=A0ABV3W5P2_9BACI
MEKKAYISLTLAGALLLTPFGNVIHAQEVEEELLEQYAENNVSNFQIEDQKYGILDVKTIEEEDKVITEVYGGTELVSKTILYKTDGKIEEFDSLGNEQVSYIEDYIENIHSIKDIEDPSTVSDMSEITEVDNNNSIQAAGYKVPSGYNYFKKEYSSAWKATGNLYKKTDVSYGKEYKFEFSPGTKFSTIVSIFTTIGNFNVAATLVSLGITVVGTAIDAYAAGKYKVRYTTDNFIVVCNGVHGLSTYQTGVDAYVYNSTNGKLSIERIRVDGDTRSHSDIIHAGIYNVMIYNS